jgi:hypothetical protein
VDANLLVLIDEAMAGSGQHDLMKQISSRAERLKPWTDTRDSIRARCALGDEFGAGRAFGETLAIYRMSLLQALGALDRTEESRPTKPGKTESWRGDVYREAMSIGIGRSWRSLSTWGTSPISKDAGLPLASV